MTNQDLWNGLVDDLSKRKLAVDDLAFWLKEINDKLVTNDSLNRDISVNIADEDISISTGTSQFLKQITNILIRNLEMFVHSDPIPGKTDRNYGLTYVRRDPNVLNHLKQIRRPHENVLKLIEKNVAGQRQVTEKIKFLNEIRRFIKQTKPPHKLILEHAAPAIQELFVQLNEEIDNLAERYENGEEPLAERGNQETELEDENSSFDQKDHFTHETVAEYLYISKSYLYKLTSNNTIPRYKPSGKKNYFLKKDLDEYLSRGRVKSQEEIEQDASTHMIKRRMKNKKQIDSLVGTIQAVAITTSYNYHFFRPPLSITNISNTTVLPN